MKKMILMIILFLSFSVNAEICAEENTHFIEGTFTNNDSFYGEIVYCRFEQPVEDKISKNTITIYIDGVANNYIYTGGLSPSIEISDLGVISIYDKYGGMQSPAKIIYLASQNKILIKLGEMNLNYNNGLVSNYFIEDVNSSIDSFNSNLLKEKYNNFIGDLYLSYTDVFLLLLSKNALKKHTDFIWMKKFYLKLRSMHYQDIINLYNQNIFFGEQTLCNQDRYEIGVFGCEIKNKQLSICYKSETQELLYRYGHKSKVELELKKNIDEIDKNLMIINFSNKNTDYIINTQQEYEGILIKRNGKLIGELKCTDNSIQPMILDGFY